jgi:hypothetical protein
MAIVRIAALENQNHYRAGDPLYKVRPACIIIGSKDTVRFLNRTGVDIELGEVGPAGPRLTFKQGTAAATKGPMIVAKDGWATIGHPGCRGHYRFKVTYESSPGNGFTSEIHGESSPEIIVDQ